MGRGELRIVEVVLVGRVDLVVYVQRDRRTVEVEHGR